MFKIVPTGFIPTQDQGYLLVNVQMPDASSIERSDAVITQLSTLALKTRGIQDAFAVSGFSILTRFQLICRGPAVFAHEAVQPMCRDLRYDSRCHPQQAQGTI
jgi:multidrug efflux pump subunit AcrB